MTFCKILEITKVIYNWFFTVVQCLITSKITPGVALHQKLSLVFHYTKNKFFLFHLPKTIDVDSLHNNVGVEENQEDRTSISYTVEENKFPQLNF